MSILDLEMYLQKFGLSDKEAKLYLALLNSGALAVRDIAKAAKLNRSTAYVLLESLTNRGLVSTIVENKIKKYSAAAPERLHTYVSEQAKESASLVGLANNIMPELKSLYTGVGPKPKIQFFEGVEGLKTAYEDTLTSSETIRAYASIKDMHDALGDYFPDYYHRRATRGINIRALLPDTPESRERVSHNKEEAREAYLVPKETFAFNSEINIYDNKVVFMSLLEKFALIIESHELVDIFKKVFELAWQEAKRINNT